jgi:hypothetical protein
MTLPDTKSDLGAMSSMLDLRGINVHVWSPQELKEMLRHQLTAPLQLSLGTLSAEVSYHIKQARLDPLLTLNQLLLHDAHPSVELLKLVKRFAKICRRDRDNALPSEIVMVMYYASIAAAMVRLDQGISDLGPASLTRGMSWLSEQDWLTNDIRALLREGVARVQVHPVTQEPKGTS